MHSDISLDMPRPVNGNGSVLDTISRAAAYCIGKRLDSDTSSFDAFIAIEPCRSKEVNQMKGSLTSTTFLPWLAEEAQRCAKTTLTGAHLHDELWQVAL